jgi:hypothetical protein
MLALCVTPLMVQNRFGIRGYKDGLQPETLADGVFGIRTLCNKAWRFAQVLVLQRPVKKC